MTVIIATDGRESRTTDEVVRDLVALDKGNHADVVVELGGVRTTDELAVRYLTGDTATEEEPEKAKTKARGKRKASTEGSN